MHPPGVNLWSEDLPEKTLVVMSGKDVLVDSKVIQDWLLGSTKAQVSNGHLHSLGQYKTDDVLHGAR